LWDDKQSVGICRLCDLKDMRVCALGEFMNPLGKRPPSSPQPAV